MDRIQTGFRCRIVRSGTDEEIDARCDGQRGIDRRARRPIARAGEVLVSGPKVRRNGKPSALVNRLLVAAGPFGCGGDPGLVSSWRGQ